MSEQFVAARYGGRAKLGKEYTNDSRVIHRLRALAGPGGRPETKVYDDLNLMPNSADQKTDVNVWHKKLD